MSVFVRKDPRLLASADPSWAEALARMLRRHLFAAFAILLLATAAYAGNVALGLHAAARTSGTLRGLAVVAPVTIVRDTHDIPYIRADNDRDLFFAQGFAEGSDRLFEMELARRYAYGTLAEVFGARALPIDERMRAADIAGIAAREWRGTDGATRQVLQAFADGVNAAEKRQPLPVEFRMLLYRPQAWTPQDSIAVSVVAAFELGDSWYDVIARDERFRTLGSRCFDAAFPLSDARYDVSLGGRLLHDAAHRDGCDGRAVAYAPSRPRLGSNAWAAGADRTLHRRALVANDPHADLTIPGIWYAMELQAPDFHAAGAAIPGVPGIALGHDERVAWAATDAEVATNAVYRAPNLPRRDRVVERFGVRFARPVYRTYYRTRDAFSVRYGEDGAYFLVRWPPYRSRTSAIPTVLALDRAKSVAQAMRVLRRYRGAPQNFILADTSGAVAYHLAGTVYDDPAWGRYVHPASALREPLRLLPFDALPARAAARNAILVSANNKMYGRGYPYRLSAAFEPPYRAYRIAQLLHARNAYTAAYFQHMQMDACSPVDAEIARDVARVTHRDAFAGWRGCFTPSSRAASREFAVRTTLLQDAGTLGNLLARLRHPGGDTPEGIEENALAALAPYPAVEQPWGQRGRVTVEHPLSAAWYGLLGGAALPGDGNDYTVHLQEPGFAQGFRAVWEAGDWNAGGIVLPSGESGEPGSGHYDDLARLWVRGALLPLPFTQRAIARHAVRVLTLRQ